MLTMPTNTQHTDILIIGAGLAGLSAASKLNNLNTKIYEALKEVSDVEDKRSLFY